MLSEPYQTDDGRWWVKSDESNETLNFATSEEAYAWYHRILALREKIDTIGQAPGTPLFNHRPPPVVGVPEAPDPVAPTPDGEAQSAYEAGTEREMSRIEYEQAKSGQTPMTYFFRKWIGPAIVGASSIAWLIAKGCQ
jgi:hypothetical protein